MTVVFYKSKQEIISRSLRLTDISTGDIPYFDIHAKGADKSVSIIMSSSNGKLKFTRNVFKDSCIEYQLPILPMERVSFIRLIDIDEALIGTSTSDVYYFFCKGGQQPSAATLDVYPLSSLRFVHNFFRQCLLPSLANSFTNNPLATGEIVDISKIDNLYYISSKKSISIWQINNKPEVQKECNI